MSVVELAVTFSTSLFISFALVPLLMRHAQQLKLLDSPDGARKLHKSLTPKTGGLAIFIAALIPLLLSSLEYNTLLPIVAGGITIAALGYIDDVVDLGPWKFLGQIVAVGLFISLSPTLSDSSFFYLSDIPLWVNQSIVVVFMIGATNAVNLSDGLDGLAAGMTLLSMFVIAFLGLESGLPSSVLVAVVLSGALLGFLRYNTHPAKVFMGDTGSQFIGFISAALAISVTQQSGSVVSPILPLFIIGIPIIDTLMVFSIRMAKGKSPFHPDKNHIHHKLLALGFHSYEAVGIMYLFQVAFIVCAYLCRYQSDLFLIVLFASSAFTVVAVIAGCSHLNVNVRRRNRTGGYERRNLALRKFNWVYVFSSDILSLLLGTLWVAIIVSHNTYTSSNHFLVVVAFATLTISLSWWKIRPKDGETITRLLAYTVMIVSVFLCGTSELGPWTSTFININLGSILILMLLSIRMTRKEHFSINTQDVLILILLVVTPLLAQNVNDELSIQGLILKMAVMIYAVEHIISKTQAHELPLKLISVISLVTIMWTCL